MVRVKHEHSLWGDGDRRKFSLFSLAVFFVVTTITSSFLPFINNTDTASAATQAEYDWCNAQALTATGKVEAWGTNIDFVNHHCSDNSMCTWTPVSISPGLNTGASLTGGWSCDSTKITTGVTVTGPPATTANLQWCRDNVGTLNQDKNWQNTQGFKDNNCGSVCKFTQSDVQSTSTGGTTPITYWQCGGASITQLTAAQACDKYPHGSTTVVSTSYDACIAGYNNAATKGYCATTYSSASQAILVDACNTGSTANVSANITPAAPTATGKPRCTGGVLGWFLCPVIELFGSAVDTSAVIIEQQLLIQPLVDSNSTTAMKAIWSFVVGFANLVLVIAFLIVIFSQATSLGLSAYGIKKMLPRIIAAAVLINLSFFICGIAIDIFNVIGASVKGLMQSGVDAVAVGTAPTGTDYAEFATASALWLVGVIGIAVGAVAIGLIGFAVPVILAGAMALLTVIIIVAMRHVLVILLIIVSPLAFAAMILPGTEPYFKKWYQAFGKLLVMYPVIMAILYGSAMASAIILATGK